MEIIRWSPNVGTNAYIPQNCYTWERKQGGRWEASRSLPGVNKSEACPILDCADLDELVEILKDLDRDDVAR